MVQFRVLKKRAGLELRDGPAVIRVLAVPLNCLRYISSSTRQSEKGAGLTWRLKHYFEE